MKHKGHFGVMISFSVIRRIAVNTYSFESWINGMMDGWQTLFS